MQELTLFEILANTFEIVKESNVALLFILEIIILITYLLFRNFMNKKVVTITSIVASVLIVLFYISSYISTVIIFIDNVSTKLMEFLYFPTTLEYAAVMIVSFIIMTATLLNKNSNKIIKVINTIIPVTLSFILFNIIEYINKSGVEFDEFSVFTNQYLTSLFEVGVGLFIAWIVGLLLYKLDVYLLNRIEENENKYKTLKIENNDDEISDEELEMPKLKSIG